MLSTTLLLLVAALNLVPGVVALRPKRTVALYGIAIDGPALALAMRHRAVLLTLVGVLLGVAAFDESWLRPALLVAFVSKGAFLTLFAITGHHGAPMRRVAIADVAALAVLALVVALRVR
ncbi:MAG: phosphopantetheine adenylyltransferase [Chloroflexi bacterium]|jgi:hypothetical protein|nr:phosphopantetheine adenylyltransferase [Chloroflexota bacterium]